MDSRRGRGCTIHAYLRTSSVNDLCLFISAVTLSLMECFDLRKIMWLLDAYRHPDVNAGQRALVGVIFIFHIYKNRLSLYNDLVKRVDLMDEISPFKEVGTYLSPNVTMPGNGKDRQENERGNHSRNVEECFVHAEHEIRL